MVQALSYLTNYVMISSLNLLRFSYISSTVIVMLMPVNFHLFLLFEKIIILNEKST